MTLSVFRVRLVEETVLQPVNQALTGSHVQHLRRRMDWRAEYMANEPLFTCLSRPSLPSRSLSRRSRSSSRRMEQHPASHLCRPS